MKIEVDARDFLENLDRIRDKVVDAWADSGDEFRRLTPVLSGNARRNTRYNDNRKEITAEYPYGAVLDEGYSKKAPNGMTSPTLTYFEQQLGRIVR